MNNFLSALMRLSFVLFTRRCEICGEVTEFNQELCDDCKSLEQIASPRCEFCGYSKEDCICKKHKNEYKQIVAPYYYKDSVARAVNNFKNHDMPFLSKRLALEMTDVINDCYGEICFDVVTYVPLRKFKKLKRGYNQSELLAKGISQSLGVKCLPLIKKVRYTGVQHFKTARERKAAVFGAYDIDKKYKSALEGKTVLLIDDIKTTGSTLNECAKMLNIYGAKAVYACTFALTKQPPKERTEAQHL